MHLAITRSFSRVSTPHVDRDLAARFARVRIEAHRAALYPEGSMDSVQKRSEGKLNSALRRIDIEIQNAGGGWSGFCRNQVATDAQEQVYD
jgi:hypothetical protein